MTIANSNFEDWRRANKTDSIDKFDFKLSKMSKAGALFDMVKLHDISKTYISTMNTDEVFDAVTAWSKEYDKELNSLIMRDTDYAKKIFSIERGNKKPRKDIGKWSEIKDYIAYFYDELFDGKYDWAENVSKDDIKAILTRYKEIYNHQAPSEDWFPQVQSLAEELGFAKSPKDYKADPDSFKGHAGDVAGVIRVAVTGRLNTPDLYSIMQTLGEDKVKERINTAIEGI